MPPNFPAADILCETCGYMLRGLPQTANCPECGRAIADSTGGHRRPASFETSPSLASLVGTAAAVLFRPGRFFAHLATRSTGTQADWFARCHRFVAAGLLSVAACGLVIIDHTFPTWLDRVGWGRDEPEVFGILLTPVAVILYLLILLAGKVSATGIAARARERAVRLSPNVVRRGMCFHSVHLVPAAFVIAAAVGGFFSLLITPMAVIFYIVVAQVTVWLAGGRIRRGALAWIRDALATVVMMVIVVRYFLEFGGARFERVGARPMDWQTYSNMLIAALLVAAGYLLLTGWIAIRNIMYANDATSRDGPR